jgi:hypothetical protein
MASPSLNDKAELLQIFQKKMAPCQGWHSHAMGSFSKAVAGARCMLLSFWDFSSLHVVVR